MSEDLATTHLATLYSLPLSVETDGLICYNEPVPDLTCDPLTPMLGDLHPDSDGLHPTTDQCFKLLKAEWPYVTHWFQDIFPDFTPPNPSSDQEKYIDSVVAVDSEVRC